MSLGPPIGVGRYSFKEPLLSDMSGRADYVRCWGARRAKSGTTRPAIDGPSWRSFHPGPDWPDHREKPAADKKRSRLIPRHFLKISPAVSAAARNGPSGFVLANGTSAGASEGRPTQALQPTPTASNASSDADAAPP